MQAHYGYEDASGGCFIIIDTDVCDGCGDCSAACPAGVLVVVDEDPNDPLREIPVVTIPAEKARKLNRECAPCRSADSPQGLPCVIACSKTAIKHSW